MLVEPTHGLNREMLCYILLVEEHDVELEGSRFMKPWETCNAKESGFCSLMSLPA